MMKYKIIIALVLLTRLAWSQTNSSLYRNHLSKLVTFNVKQQSVRNTLQQISTAGNFYFSYNGKLINQDSLVNLNVQRMPVRDVLDKLFAGKVDYKENAEYVILRYAVNHFTIEPDHITRDENLYLISGYIVDTETGKKVKQASVYEKRLLQSTLTDDHGFFTLRFKGEHKEVILTASKETYRDTALVFLADIKIQPQAYNDLDKERGTVFSNTFEDLGISKFLVSSKQRIQSLNIPSFFANTPFQASLLPGLSSHGMMSSRVVNKASLNVLGGYTAGVDGVEVGGLFNLTIGHVKSFQAAGLFNAVGGHIEAAQFAGLINYGQKNMSGLQAAGLVNIVNGDVAGTQFAGLMNYSKQDVKAFQAAGIVNFVNGYLNGVQVSGVFNYAKKLRGLQIGLINLADSSLGTSIGLLNLSKNGYKKVSFFANDVVNANVALKTGNANLYTLLMAGKNYTDSAKVETAGIGFGHDFLFGKHLAIQAEVNTQYVYLGNLDYVNILMRFQTHLEIKLFKGFSIFGGPSYAYYNSDAPVNSSAKGYKQNIAPTKHHSFSRNNQGWWGWNAGITLF